MTSPPAAPRTWRWLCLLALALAALPAAWAQESGPLAEEESAPVVTDTQLTLGQAFQAALARAPGTEGLAAQVQGATAAKARSNSFIAGVPSVQLRYLSDRLQTRQGVTESEAGVELPLWRWGQRQAAAALAGAQQRGAVEDTNVHRWQVAGAVRESYWQVREAEERLTLARREVQAFQALEAEVQRRIAAGDAAPGERLTAEGQRLEREAAVHEAEVVLADRYFGWRVLTGLSALPRPAVEQTAPENSGFPPLQAARMAAQQAEAALKAAHREGAGNPRLLLGVRHDTQTGGPTVESLAAQLSLPFGGGSHRQAALSPLQLEAARSRDVVSQMERESALAHHEAEHELHAREIALSDASARSAVASDELALARRAYALGESALAERLLTERRAAEAQRSHRLADIAHARAIARFNQINGVLP